MSRVYISDANILIDFRNAGLLEALFELPIVLCCTDFVIRELKDISRSELERLGLRVEVIEAQGIPRLYELRMQHNNSSLADVSCYFLAQETGRPLLTGDGRLRRQAIQDGLQVHGALWLLDQLLAAEIVTHDGAADALDCMIMRGARFPLAECQARLAAWRNRPTP
ncbi:nucleotide-binding protein [Aquipseudomonas alcaligenes]|uniref:Nucleotide-binding protein n=1 Tax=Aquipseudomonas alcaligenes TaxID=43263 RepID=A0A2V4KQL1_AQUAC|nr:type II toxin-antitoxin system VapC family toxin [Pseudomonas alcaligenes]PYC20254.1 nucleotide-binding protein [Pseudomonas alcaligenes]